MLQTYNATLNGDRLSWCDTPPKTEGEVEVYVTVHQPVSNNVNLRAMADALEEIASRSTLSVSLDPVHWQQEVRRDRPLPGQQW
jgi:hypothetical protein